MSDHEISVTIPADTGPLIDQLAAATEEVSTAAGEMTALASQTGLADQALSATTPALAALIPVLTVGAEATMDLGNAAATAAEKAGAVGPFAQASLQRSAILKAEVTAAAAVRDEEARHYLSGLQQVDAADKRVVAQKQAGLMRETAFLNAENDKQVRAEIEHNRALVQQQQLSAQDAGQRERALTDTMYREDLRRLDQEMLSLAAGTREWRAASEARVKIAQEQAIALQRLDDKIAGERVRKEQQTGQEIVRTGSQTIMALITGRQTLLQAVDSLAERQLQKVIESGLQELVADTGIQSAIVAATEAGEQSKLAAKIAGAAEGKAVEASAGSTTVLGDAHKAFAGAYAAVAGIPIIGPVLAPIAGATAYAAVAAMDIFSAEGGMANVPYDGAMIQAHAKEMMLPASIAQPLRESIASGNLGGAAAGDQYHAHFHGPIGSGIKPGDLRDAVVTALKQAHRQGAFA